MVSETYLDFLIEKLQRLKETQIEKIELASEAIAIACSEGGQVYIFGSGHSHMIAEEIYLRAGGLALVKAILPGELMLHEMPNKSTQIERLEGYSKPMLELHKPTNKDILIVISNSGRNNVPVEMCMAGKELGMKVIAITSMEHSSAENSRHKSGLRMFEIADIVIDNLTPKGDAEFKVANLDTPTGSTSSLTGIAIIQTVMTSAIEKMIQKNYQPPVFKSSNVDGGDIHNNELFDKYYGFWK